MPSRRVPPERRKRTEISCDKCKSRKQKCHRLLSELSRDGYDSRAPCRYCQTHGFECVTTQMRKKRVFATVEESLEARVGLLESLVKGLVPEVDTSSVEGLRALGVSLGITMPELSDTRRGSGTPAGASSSDQVDFKGVDGKSGTVAHEGKREEQMPVLRDQQGQMQYIGPASSYIFQIRMRAILAGRNSHCQSQGQFFLFANNATDKAWVGKVADIQREMSAGRTPPLEPDELGSGVDEDDYDSDDGREESVRTEESLLSGALPNRLVDAFFERIHPDFPVLSEECFRRKYERFRQRKSSPLGGGGGADTDASWVCSFLCILILARRTVPPDGGDDDILSTALGQEAEARWWRKVQTLLPSVVFTSCTTAVQALLLAALHLNNTNNKDSCWTLTGAAVRIAIAIGLHRDATLGTDPKGAAEAAQNPVLLLRKRLWWTLYQFELMQAASLDRPSAIDDAACNTRVTIQPLPSTGADAAEYYSIRLLRMLSQACRVVRTMNNSSSASGESSDDSYSGPVSPAASLIRDMRRWRDGLPRELSQQAATMETSTFKQEAGQGSIMAPRSRRTLLLMHVQYHHILCVITRNPMLAAASRLFDNSSSHNDDENQHHSSNRLGVPEGGGGCNAFLTDVCIAAAQDSARLLLRLDADGLFDQVTWFDFYFLYQAAQVLVLGVMYDAKRGDNRRQPSHTTTPAAIDGGGGDSNSRLDTSRALLHSCAELAGRVARNPLVPGTIHRFAVVVGELVGLVEDFIRGPAIVEGRVAVDVATGPPTAASAGVPLSSHPGLPTMSESGGAYAHQHQHQHQQHQPSYCHADDGPHINDHQASHMDIDAAAAVFEHEGGIHHEQEPGSSDLVMVGTPSDIQFPADMAAHFGFPDGSWTYREGQWNDFGSMILGGGYGS
ncbi:hypothetical protein PG985_009722 [Apiospora marii]|uniref:uncharacterized protein n=1 Tax=Apiospora marii TaxID=335849 RepID=UPI0031302199